MTGTDRTLHALTLLALAYLAGRVLVAVLWGV